MSSFILPEYWLIMAIIFVKINFSFNLLDTFFKNIFLTHSESYLDWMSGRNVSGGLNCWEGPELVILVSFPG